jgi:hypothetical protein
LIFNLFFILTFSAFSLSFDKDFKTINDRVPLEFNHLFESLKGNISSIQEQKKIIDLCKELNENLGLLQKEHIFLLMKSEVIKHTLEHKHKKFNTHPINKTLISHLEQDFQNKQAKLSSFSKWIWESMVAELKYREGMNLISEKNFNVTHFSGPSRALALRFERYLIFLIPWIDKMLSLNPEEFNKLTRKVSWIILQSLNQRSLLFKQLSSTSSSETKIQIFNIPSHLAELKSLSSSEKTQSKKDTDTLTQESKMEKSRASEEIKNVSPDDLSPLSDEVTKEIEQNTP